MFEMLWSLQNRLEMLKEDYLIGLSQGLRLIQKLTGIDKKKRLL